MNESGRRAFGFSRDEIGVLQLETLEEKFADGNLNENEFISLFKEIIDPSPSKLQLIELFRKIDANSDGTVDWDELTNYMFLDGSNANSIDSGDGLHLYYETNQAEAKSHSQKRPGARHENVAGLPSETSRSLVYREKQHKDCVTRILRVEKLNQYITTSKDGTVRTWNPLTLEYQGCLTTQNGWITDCCYMKRSNRLAIISMNRNLSFYDLNAHGTIGKLPDYSKKQCIPLCVAYIDEAYDSMEALVVGDDSGGLTVMKCSAYWDSIDARSLPKRVSANTSTPSSNLPAETLTRGPESSTFPHVNASSSSLLDQRAFSSQVRLKKHSDWITSIKWVGEIQAIVAGSLDSTISIVDVDRMVTKFEYTQHKKSVFDLIWCSSARLVASCGLERDISIWNPYSCQRAVGMLRGHNTSVSHLASDDTNQQLISVSSENVFKIWDLRTQRCLQTFTDTFASTGGARHTVSSIFHDSKLGCLMSATLGLSRWPFKQFVDEEFACMDNSTSFTESKPKDVLISNQRSSRETPVSLAIYNDVFNQIVTADSESIVRVWSAESGQGTFHFENAHGSSPITAITFDSAGRRLLTGAHDGTCISMWNFSNGALVKRFYKKLGVLPDQETHKSRPCIMRRPAGRHLTIPNAPSTPRTPSRPASSRQYKNLELAAGEYGPEMVPGLKITQSKPENERPATSRKMSLRSEFVSEELEDPTEEEDDDKYMGDSTIEMREHRVRLPQPSPSPPKAPEEQASKCVEMAKSNRRGNEVTCILDIERNIRVGMADCVCQRLICSVGWDDTIYIWEDKMTEKEIYPLDVLPHSCASDSKESAFHVQDLLVLVFIPPSHIATAGGDGQILLWSLNARKAVMQLYKGIGSIEAMVYAEKLEILFAAGEGENLICISPDRGTSQTLSLKLTKCELDSVIVSMRCDKANSVIVTGDSTGVIKLWDLQISETNTSILVGYICHWKLGLTSIISLDLLESNLSHQFYILVSSIQGHITIWTMCGILVGVVGRQKTWKLGHPSTYLSKKSACHWAMPSDERHKGIGRRESLFTISTSVHFLQMIRPPQTLPCAILSSLHGELEQQENASLEDLVPRPGEVWVCLAGHRGKASKSNVPGQNDNKELGLPPPQDVQRYLDHMLQDEITSVITVIRVSRGEISFWFGFEVESPQQKTIRLNEFVQNIFWKKQRLLTQYIDRTFSEAGQSYRVSAIMVKTMHPVQTTSFDREFWAMDVEGCEHKLQPLNCSISPARLKAIEEIQAEQMQMEAKNSDKRRGHGSILSVSRPLLLEDRSILVNTAHPEVGPVHGKEASVRLSSIVTLPRVFQATEKLSLGGIPLKMSAIRMRHDPSIDFRRIYNLDKVPKEFRALLNQNCEVKEENGKEISKKTLSKSFKDRRGFAGIVPMSQ